MEKICKQCNKLFKKKQYCSKKNWIKVKYCSMKCTQLNTNKNLKPGTWRKGVKLNLTKEQRIKIGDRARGSNNWNWKGGKSGVKRQIYNLLEYRQWRSNVFKRDNFACRECLIRNVQFDCHHIKGFSKIINENNINNTEDAINCAELWDINNGITLCRECHKKTDNYSYKTLLTDRKTGKFIKTY